MTTCNVRHGSGKWELRTGSARGHVVIKCFSWGMSVCRHQCGILYISTVCSWIPAQFITMWDIWTNKNSSRGIETEKKLLRNTNRISKLIKHQY